MHGKGNRMTNDNGISKWGIDTEIATQTVRNWVLNDPDEYLYRGAIAAAFEGTAFDASIHYPSDHQAWSYFISEAASLIESFVKDHSESGVCGYESDLIAVIIHDYLDSVDWRTVAESILDPN